MNIFFFTHPFVLENEKDYLFTHIICHKRETKLHIGCVLGPEPTTSYTSTQIQIRVNHVSERERVDGSKNNPLEVFGLWMDG
jgi:hypothetical protein